MYGDTSIIRQHASNMRTRSGQIRDTAQLLGDRVGGTLWTGWASEEMRELAHRRTTSLRRAADHHDDAARALDRHADEVDRIKALIADIERQFHRLVESAKDLGDKVLDTIKDVASGDFDLKDWVDNFDAPPPGSKEWLDVHLPEA